MNEQEFWDQCALVAFAKSFDASLGLQRQVCSSDLAALAADVADRLAANRRKRIEKGTGEPHPDNERATSLLRMVISSVRPDLDEREQGLLDGLADRLEGKR